MWSLIFTVFITSSGGFSKQIVDVLGPYETRGECIDESFGERRKELEKEHDALIHAHCVPEKWLK